MDILRQHKSFLIFTNIYYLRYFPFCQGLTLKKVDPTTLVEKFDIFLKSSMKVIFIK